MLDQIENISFSSNLAEIWQMTDELRLANPTNSSIQSLLLDNESIF